LKFNFPQKNKLYVLKKDWNFHLKPDYLNGCFLDFLLNEGIGVADFDSRKCKVVLKKGTILSVSMYDDKKIMFDIVKFSLKNVDLKSRLLFHIPIKELKTLEFEEENVSENREQNSTSNTSGEQE